MICSLDTLSWGCQQNISVKSITELSSDERSVWFKNYLIRVIVQIVRLDHISEEGKRKLTADLNVHPWLGIQRKGILLCRSKYLESELCKIINFISPMDILLRNICMNKWDSAKVMFFSLTSVCKAQTVESTALVQSAGHGERRLTKRILNNFFTSNNICNDLPLYWAKQ